MLDGDSCELLNQLRDLGVAAAKAEDGRRKAEEALEAERSRSIEIRRDADAQVGSARAEAEDLRRQLVALQAEAQDAAHWRDESGRLQQQLQEAKESASAAAVMMRSELDRIRQKLKVVQDASDDAASLREEVATLRQRLEESEAAGAKLKPREDLMSENEKLKAENEDVRRRAWGLQSNAERLRQELDQKQDSAAEAAKLKRDVRGMSALVRTLKQKLQIYEARLMDQARTCADELNDMKSKIVDLQSTEADDDDDDVDWNTNKEDLEESTHESQGSKYDGSTGNSLGILAALPSTPRTWLPLGTDAPEDGYLRMDDKGHWRAPVQQSGREAGWMNGTHSRSNSQVHSVLHEDLGKMAGTYRPPSIPDSSWGS